MRSTLQVTEHATRIKMRDGEAAYWSRVSQPLPPTEVAHSQLLLTRGTSYNMAQGRMNSTGRGLFSDG